MTNSPEGLTDWLCVRVGGAYSDMVGVLYTRWSRAASVAAKEKRVVVY